MLLNALVGELFGMEMNCKKMKWKCIHLYCSCYRPTQCMLAKPETVNKLKFTVCAIGAHY